MNSANPPISYVNFIQIQGNFALCLILDAGVLQLCDPFSLQPFLSLKLPLSHGCFADHYSIENNILTALGST